VVPVGPATDADGNPVSIMAFASHNVIFSFHADETVYGNPLSLERMQALGWVEVDAIGVSIASHQVSTEPKVNDVVLLNGGADKPSILQVGRRSSNGVDFLYPAQLR